MNRIWSIRNVIEPASGMQVMTDRWWLCIDDLTKALFYGDSPQCNSNKQVCLIMSQTTMPLDAAKQFNGELKVVFAPISYRCVDHGEFYR